MLCIEQRCVLLHWLVSSGHKASIITDSPVALGIGGAGVEDLDLMWKELRLPVSLMCSIGCNNCLFIVLICVFWLFLLSDRSSRSSVYSGLIMPAVRANQG